MSDDSSISFTATGIPPNIVSNYRQSVRVLGQVIDTTQLQFTGTGIVNNPVSNYRQSIRVLGQRAAETTQLFFQFDHLSFPNNPVSNYRESVRVIGPRIVETASLVSFTVEGVPTLTVRVWDGTQFVHVPLETWEGSEFANPLGLLVWDGTSFRPQG